MKLNPPSILVKSVTISRRQVFNSKLFVCCYEYMAAPLEKIAIDYSAQKIRGTAYIKTSFKEYGFNSETGEYDEEGPLLRQEADGALRKTVCHFDFSEADQFLEIL